VDDATSATKAKIMAEDAGMIRRVRRERAGRSEFVPSCGNSPGDRIDARDPLAQGRPCGDFGLVPRVGSREGPVQVGEHRDVRQRESHSCKETVAFDQCDQAVETRFA
jgi:hypothetical protein